jgi:hypothetical protein
VISIVRQAFACLPCWRFRCWRRGCFSLCRTSFGTTSTRASPGVHNPGSYVLPADRPVVPRRNRLVHNVVQGLPTRRTQNSSPFRPKSRPSWPVHSWKRTEVGGRKKGLHHSIHSHAFAILSFSSKPTPTPIFLCGTYPIYIVTYCK